jgi:hypothetical protein
MRGGSKSLGKEVNGVDSVAHIFLELRHIRTGHRLEPDTAKALTSTGVITTNIV